jgi:arylsulfatase
MKNFRTFLPYVFVAFVTLASVSPAESQQVTGTPGSPSATTTIPGNQLPAPAP